MNRNEYQQHLKKAFDTGKISEEAYDAAYENAGEFCPEEKED